MLPEDQKAMPGRPGRSQRMVSAGRRGSIACVRLTLHKLRQADRTNARRVTGTQHESREPVISASLRSARQSLTSIGRRVSCDPSAKAQAVYTQQLCRWLHLGDLTLTPAQNLVLQGVRRK